jgi:hypothetical protein
MSIAEALQLIDEWLEQLEDGDLPDACRSSGRDFFSFFTARGVDPAQLSRLVKLATGYDPETLPSAAGSATLRLAIASYESSCAHVLHDPAGEGSTPEQVKDNALDKARWWWEW